MISLNLGDQRDSGDDVEILKKGGDEHGNKKPLFLKLEPEYHAMLDEMVKFTGTSKTDVIKKAIRFVYENQFAKKK